MKSSPNDAFSHEHEVEKVRIDGASRSTRPSIGKTHPDDLEASVALGEVEEAARDIYGFSPIPAGGFPVTNELVNELREDLGV